MTLIIFELYPPNYGRAARKFLQTAKSELFTRRYNVLMQLYDSIHFEWVEEMPLGFAVG